MTVHFLTLLSMAQKSINIWIIYFLYMFTEIGFLCDINLVVKKIILIDLHDKVTMSETFDKSQMSESFDVPPGCIRLLNLTRLLLITHTFHCYAST